MCIVVLAIALNKRFSSLAGLAVLCRAEMRRGPMNSFVGALERFVAALRPQRRFRAAAQGPVLGGRVF
jgi:hypothetical protein